MRCVELGLQVARLVRGRVIVRRSGVRVNGGTHYLTAAAAAAATASLQGPLCVLQIPVVQRSVLSQRIAGVASAVAGTPSASPDEDTVQLQPSPPAGSAPWDDLMPTIQAEALDEATLQPQPPPDVRCSSAELKAQPDAAAILDQGTTATAQPAGAKPAGSKAAVNAFGVLMGAARKRKPASTTGGDSSEQAKRLAPAATPLEEGLAAGTTTPPPTTTTTAAAAAMDVPAASVHPRAVATRNAVIVRSALEAAAASGRQPSLQDLLVEQSWQAVLEPVLSRPSAAKLQSFLHNEWTRGVVYPPREAVFAAFNSLPFDQVRVVILGQDPYINPGEAMGLSFSVPPGVRVPPSLANMYKELSTDVGCVVPNHGCLEKWVDQGVLLLNAVLTVRAGASNSHAGQGWEAITSAALAALAARRRGLIFMLWGNKAQERCAKLDMTSHHVLKAVHPSPLAAHRGFFGCRHFSRANALLQQQGLEPIDWQIERINT